MLNKNAKILQPLDGTLYDAWKGVNDVIVQYGRVEISKVFS